MGEEKLIGFMFGYDLEVIAGESERWDIIVE